MEIQTVIPPVLWLLLLGACVPPESKPPPPRPEVVLYGVTLRSYRGNTVTATGQADKLAYERGSSNIELTSPNLLLPARAPTEGKHAVLGEVRLKSAQAEGNIEAKKLEAYAGVHLESASGTVADTDRALFDGEAAITSGAGPVRVRAPSYALDAIGFVLRSRDEDFEFGGPLKSGLGRVTE